MVELLKGDERGDTLAIIYWTGAGAGAGAGALDTCLEWKVK